MSARALMINELTKSRHFKNAGSISSRIRGSSVEPRMRHVMNTAPAPGLKACGFSTKKKIGYKIV